MAPESGVRRPSDGTQRRRRLLLAALVIVLGVVLYAVWPRPAAPVATTSNTRGPAQRATAGQSIEAPDVQLEALEGERPKPDGVDRNLFQFRAAAAAPPTPPAPPQPKEVQAPPTPIVPSAPTVPPIPLRFIGVMEAPDGRKHAILRDDRGVYYGAEGAVIDGRYKILRIGDESIEMAYVDGRGRQVLRLAGS